MQYKSKAILAIAVASAVMLPGPAAARQGNHMQVTGGTSQPIGHYEYCKQYRRDCQLRSSNTTPMPLTRDRWSELDSINRGANAAVTPITDMDYYQVEELWTYPDRYGDCEDFVLLKRHMLMQRGWPASSLLITVVRQPNGDGHAVLTVRTDRADYVLDNLSDRILPWNETEYRFLKRQSAKDSGRWEGIEDSRPGYVGSVR